MKVFVLFLLFLEVHTSHATTFSPQPPLAVLPSSGSSPLPLLAGTLLFDEILDPLLAIANKAAAPLSLRL